MSRPDPKPRPELTPEHKILHKMEKTFRSFSKPVGCSGTIPLQGDLDKVALWYEQPPSSDASNAVQFKYVPPSPSGSFANAPQAHHNPHFGQCRRRAIRFRNAIRFRFRTWLGG